MENRIERLVREQLVDDGAVGHVSLNELRTRRDALAHAGREVVEHRDGEAVGKEPIAKVASDEACAPGHENSSHRPVCTSSRRIWSSETVTLQPG